MKNQDCENVAGLEKKEACQMNRKALIQVLVITATNGFAYVADKIEVNPFCDATTQVLAEAYKSITNN